MSEPALRRMSVAEFLDWDDGTETRYELIDGVPVAMAPATPAHAELVVAVGGVLQKELNPPCRARTAGGVISPERDNLYLVPDLVVTCSPVDPRERYLNAPLVVIEVFSTATVNHDIGLKANAYRAIASIQEIVFVSSEARHVELWRREGETWRIFDLIGDATVTLSSLDVAFGLAEIYEGIVL